MHRPNSNRALPLAGLTALALAATVAFPGPARGEDAPPQASGWATDFGTLLGRAVEQVEASARSVDPERRANAMELCESLGRRRAEPLLALGIEDPTVPVRYCAVVNAGRLEVRTLLPRIRELAAADSAYERAAVIFAQHMMDDSVDVTPFAHMLTSDDPGLRGSAAMLLGMMGDDSAVPMLRDLAKVPLPSTIIPVSGVIVRMQIAEARVRLGDESTYNAIRWGLFSDYAEVQVLAASMVGRLGDRKMEEALFAGF